MMFEINIGALVQSWFFQGVSSSIHRLNRRCLKSNVGAINDDGFELTLVQLSRGMVFQLIRGQLRSPVEPTLHRLIARTSNG